MSRLKKFLGENELPEMANLNYTYPGSEKDICAYRELEQVFSEKVAKKGTDTEIDNIKKALKDAVSAMFTKQTDYDKNIDRLV
jgi:hypothetical protein